ncbi:MAG: hypothetical protein Q7U14_00255 [Lacisediminimonas sp.]|nr:hypothetical protein [Lacisediminimonas sp.]
MPEHLERVYPDRRDRYGYTVLSRSRAIRAIRRSGDELVRRLIESDLLDILVAAQAILPPRVVRGRQDNYVFLVQKRIRPAIVPSEWSPTMFADAALLILRAEQALCAQGMTVDDPHPWNILFDEGTPYIVDMGAFNVAGTGLHWSAKSDAGIWPASSVFNAFFLNVVALSAAGRAHYVRRALTDWTPLPGSDTALLLLKNPALLLSFLAIRLQTFIFRAAWRLFTPTASASRKIRLKSAYLGTLDRHLQRMRSRIARRMTRTAVETGADLSAGATAAIATLNDQHPSQRLLVFGASRKTVDHIHAAATGTLLVVSPDEALIDQLYQSALGRMAVAVMDLRSPTPGAGPGNRWITPAIERFRSDVGIFFFDLEELVIEKCLTVSELVQAADKLSETAALIIFTKLPADNTISGRNYGQTTDQVLLACLQQDLEGFEVIYNNHREMAVTFERRSQAHPDHASRK